MIISQIVSSPSRGLPSSGRGCAQQGNSEVVEMPGEQQVQERHSKEGVCLSTSNATSEKALRMFMEAGGREEHSRLQEQS